VLAIINDVENREKQININKAHAILRHLSEKMTREVTQTLGWKLIGEKQVCEHCAIGKGQQSNVEKQSNHIVSNKVEKKNFWMFQLLFQTKIQILFLILSTRSTGELWSTKHLNSKFLIFYNQRRDD
jgi:hypothetical protein